MTVKAGSAQQDERPKVASGLGERVREARRALGLSQAQLAGEDLTKGFISQLESGLVRPSIRSLQLIASRLGKPLDYFIGDEPLAAGKRLAFHRLAAEAAAERREWAEVRRNVGAALEQQPTGQERVQVLLLGARAENASRGFERAFEIVSEALGLIDATTAPSLAAELLYVRGVAYGELGQLVAATEALEAARDLIEKHEVIDPRLRSRIIASLGTVYRRLNRTSKAVTAYQEALSAASRTSELAGTARILMGIAATHYDSGELDASVATYRRALELFRQVADLDFELGAMQSIADVQYDMGDIPAAKASAKRTMDRALEVADERWAAVAEIILARVALKEGDPAEALRMAKHAERILADTDDKIEHANSFGAIGAALDALGKHAEADRFYRRSIELYTEIGDYADRSGMAAEYARVLRARGEVDKAFEMLELARGAAARS